MKEEIQKKHDEFNILWKRIQQVENAKEIPQIEIDLGLEKIRELYDYFIQLNNINKKTMDVSEIIAESSEKENKSKLKQIFSKSKKKEEKQAQEDIIIEEEQVAIINETPIVIEEKVAPEIIFEPVAEIIAPVKEENENKIIVEKTEIVKQEKTAEEVKKEALIDVLSKSDVKQDFATKLQQKSISDISQEIGLADKLLFINKLFDKNPEMFSETVTFLNKCSSFAEASEFLKNQFKWNEEDETTLGFLDVVKRKFN